jgi:hypothetical protein
MGFAKTEIEAPLVLKHVSYLSTLKNPIFKLVTRVNTRDFTVYTIWTSLR